MNSVENRISFIQNGQKRFIEDRPQPSVSKSYSDKQIKSEEINSIDLYLDEIGTYPLLTLEQEKYYIFTLKAGQNAWFELKRKVLGNHLKRNVKSELEVLLAESENITNQKELESRLKQKPSHNGRKKIKDHVADLESGREAFILLVNSNLRLVVGVAKKYNKKPENLPDLIQEGNSGLIRAIQKFDPNKNNRYHKISTYAIWWIRQAMKRGVVDKDRIIAIPPHMQELSRNIMVASDTLAQKMHKEPSLDELSYYLKLQPQQVQDALNLPLANSLEIEVSEDGQDQLKDFLADPNQNTPNAAEKIILNQKVRLAVDKLPERERVLIQLRFGLSNGYTRKLRQVAKHFQFTRERARQVESEALLRLRQILADESDSL